MWLGRPPVNGDTRRSLRLDDERLHFVRTVCFPACPRFHGAGASPPTASTQLGLGFAWYIAFGTRSGRPGLSGCLRMQWRSAPPCLNAGALRCIALDEHAPTQWARIFANWAKIRRHDTLTHDQARPNQKAQVGPLFEWKRSRRNRRQDRTRKGLRQV